MTPPIGWTGTVLLPGGPLEVEVVGHDPARPFVSSHLGAPPRFETPGHALVLVRCAARPEVRGVVAVLARWPA